MHIGVLYAHQRTTLPTLISGFWRKFEDGEVQLNTNLATLTLFYHIKREHTSFPEAAWDLTDI